jgi:hypothetical protein
VVICGELMAFLRIGFGFGDEIFRILEVEMTIFGRKSVDKTWSSAW